MAQTFTPGLLTYVQCSQVQDTRGALSLLEDMETNSSSDSPVKKLSVSSELLLSRCFLDVLEAFLEFDPDSVLALSFVLLFFDRRVEVFDLLDFFDLVEFFDLRGRIVWEIINKNTLCVDLMLETKTNNLHLFIPG